MLNKKKFFIGDYAHIFYDSPCIIGMFTRKPLPVDNFLTTIKPLDTFSWVGFLCGTLIITWMAKFIMWILLPKLEQEEVFSSVFLGFVGEGNIQINRHYKHYKHTEYHTSVDYQSIKQVTRFLRESSIGDLLDQMG
jgi:hypothetical protein